MEKMVDAVLLLTWELKKTQKQTQKKRGREKSLLPVFHCRMHGAGYCQANLRLLDRLFIGNHASFPTKIKFSVLSTLSTTRIQM